MSVCFVFQLSSCALTEGSFENNVDKMRWVGGQEMPVFSHFWVEYVHIEEARESIEVKIVSP